MNGKDKKDIIFTVSIVWKSSDKMSLLCSVYPFNDGAESADEALGKAVIEQRKLLDNPSNYAMAMHNTSTTWQENKKPDLSCLKYC